MASGLWRSEDMVLAQIHVQREAAHDTVLSLGRLGCVQFRDMHAGISAFQRMFINDVRRCEESERRLRYFEEQLRRAKKGIVDPAFTLSGVRETLDTLEPKLESTEAELKELTTRYAELTTQLNSLLEYNEVLSQDLSFYGMDAADLPAGDHVEDKLSYGRVGGLRCLIGVVGIEKTEVFQRLVFRATRGNMFMRTASCSRQFEDPKTGKAASKCVFVVFCSSERAFEKIKKLCTSMEANIYPYNPEDVRGNEQQRLRVTEGITSINQTIVATNDVRNETLSRVSESLYNWKRLVIVEKSAFNVLNCMEFKGHLVIATFWIPAERLEDAQLALKEAEELSSAQMPTMFEILQTDEQPPTYFKTNRFTTTFQGIVDAYGIARYKEVNPGVFTIVTFPFLFGVMYGDIGHAFLLLIFTLWMIYQERSLLNQRLNEIFALIFNGRYVLLLMSLFAMWMGFLYNDMFGIMIQAFGKGQWIFPASKAEALQHCREGYVRFNDEWADVTQGCPKKGAPVYAFGVDPGWSEADNKLEFMNSMKMKMAVILGITQMLIGEVLKLLNCVFFRDWKNMYFIFIPEVLFLCCTFGYMDVMIIIKWLTDWTKEMGQYGHQPPSVLVLMTNVFLAPGSLNEGDQLYGRTAQLQSSLQVVLLLIAFIAAPIMLIPIPTIEWFHHKKQLKQQQNIDHQPLLLNRSAADAYGTFIEHEEGVDGHVHHGHGHGHGHEEFDLSEVIIHSVIHTVEYVLGCVSNTASYLRLWALSLAHAELSEVFLNYAFIQRLESDNIGILTFVAWSVWGAATIGVLIGMEALSAFLHSLRLHWVEFQNKFYSGDGEKFAPYNIEQLVPKPFEMQAQLVGSAE